MDASMAQSALIWTKKDILMYFYIIQKKAARGKHEKVALIEARPVL